VGVVLLLPFVFVVVAAIAAVLTVRLSTLRITNTGVEIRNYPQAAKVIPLERVDHFEGTTATGNFKSLRPITAALVLTDGSRLPVRTIAAPDAGYGVEALNKRVEALQKSSGSANDSG
jgi:hypothetical protein